MKSDLMPTYLYIPVPFFEKDIYWNKYQQIWMGMAFTVLSLIVSYCYFGDKTILDVIPIESLFILIGFFFVAFELDYNKDSKEKETKKDYEEDKPKATFKILLKSFLAGVSLFVINYIFDVIVYVHFDNHNAIIMLKNIFGNISGLCFIILLYILINRIRTLFLKISEQYKEKSSIAQIK